MRKKIKLSDREQKLLDLIPSDGSRIRSDELIERYYSDGEEKPFSAREVLTGRIRSIIRKQEFNKDKKPIKASGARGPNPIEYWR